MLVKIKEKCKEALNKLTSFNWAKILTLATLKITSTVFIFVFIMWFYIIENMPLFDLWVHAGLGVNITLLTQKRKSLSDKFKQDSFFLVDIFLGVVLTFLIWPLAVYNNRGK